MTRSDNIDQLSTALAAAQGKIENASKDSANPFFKSRYADLASVWDAIRGPLSANGLAVLQLPSADGPKVTVTTLLSHSSGQWICSELTVTAKEDAPQAVGSAITYARRYGLQSIVGVAPEDDDGESAQGRPAQRPNGSGQWAQQSRAAQEVAARKIEDLKRNDTEPVSSPAVGIKQRLEQFKKMREAIGDKNYYRILGANGYEHANEITSLSKAREIYKEMAAELDERQAMNQEEPANV